MNYYINGPRLRYVSLRESFGKFTCGKHSHAQIYISYALMLGGVVLFSQGKLLLFGILPENTVKKTVTPVRFRNLPKVTFFFTD